MLLMLMEVDLLEMMTTVVVEEVVVVVVVMVVVEKSVLLQHGDVEQGVAQSTYCKPPQCFQVHKMTFQPKVPGESSR